MYFRLKLIQGYITEYQHEGGKVFTTQSNIERAKAFSMEEAVDVARSLYRPNKREALLEPIFTK